MPSSDVLGAHHVLSEANPGRTLRLEDIIEDAQADELTVRRGVDQLALEGQVKRIYVGHHAMVKKTDEFDPDSAPDVEVADDSATGSAGLTRGLSPVNYERPVGKVLDPADDYELPGEAGGLVPADDQDTPGCPKGHTGWHDGLGKALPKQILQLLGRDQADQP